MPAIPLREWIEALGMFYDQYGYLVVFLGTLSENTALLGLALPGNSLALLGAFCARGGTLNLGWVIFFAWLGTVLGYHADYLLGRFALVHDMARRRVCNKFVVPYSQPQLRIVSGWPHLLVSYS